VLGRRAGEEPRRRAPEEPRPATPRPPAVERLIHLQRHAGNAAVVRALQRTVTIDHPAVGEVVRPPHYAVRMAPQGSTKNVAVELDGAWSPADRFAENAWWWDWRNPAPGVHQLRARSDDDGGTTTTVGPVDVPVGTEQALVHPDGTRFTFLVVPDAWGGPLRENVVKTTPWANLQAAWTAMLGPTGDGLGTQASGSHFKVDNAATGKGGAAAQARELLHQLGTELARSQAYRDTVVPLVLGRLRTATGGVLEIAAHLGKDSVAFLDSAQSLNVDVADLGHFPDNPDTVPGTTKQIGLPRGEMLMHVIEERIYMGQGMTYAQAHEKCLEPGSAQNRYRRERGMTSDSIQFHCQPHYHHPNTPEAQKLSDFIATDSEGYVTKIRDILGNREADPTANYTPTTAQGSHPARVDPGLHVGREYYKALHICKSKLTRGAAVDNLAEILPALHHWCKLKETRDGVAADSIKAAATLQLLEHKIDGYLESKGKATMVDSIPAYNLHLPPAATAGQKATAAAPHVTNLLTGWAGSLSATLAQAQVAQAAVETRRGAFAAAKTGQNSAATQGDITALPGNLAVALDAERLLLEAMRARNAATEAQRTQFTQAAATHGIGSPQAQAIATALAGPAGQQRAEIATWLSQPRYLTFTHPQSGPIQQRPWVLHNRQRYKNELAEIERANADAVLAQRAADAESEDLANKRRGRSAIQYLNDATGGTEKYNCSLVVVGSVVGVRSGDVTLAIQRSKGAREQADLQTDSTWWLADVDRGGARDKSYNPDFAFHEAVGDAQWYGIEAYLRGLPSVVAGTHELQVEGRPEVEEMLPEATLLQRLATYPNGAQFAVFLTGERSGVGAQHYLYAERYNGHTIFEDYQFNKPRFHNATPSGEFERPTGYVDKLPFAAITKAPETYNAGCFVALRPKPNAVRALKIDHPVADATLFSRNYVVKISSPASVNNVKVRIDGTEHQCRNDSPGQWSFNWTACTHGTHSLAAVAWEPSGGRQESAPFEITSFA
jgi:hypothetical protein